MRVFGQADDFKRWTQPIVQSLRLPLAATGISGGGGLRPADQNRHVGKAG